MKHLLTKATLAVVFLTACEAERRSDNSAEIVPVTQPLLIDTAYNSDYVAEIRSRQNVEIRTRVKGYLEKIVVDEGQHVQEGQLLFTIGNQEYKEELLKAQAMLKSAIADAKAAELDLLNVKLLTEKNIVSETEMGMAKAKLEALHARIEEMRAHEASARLRLSYTEIRAPFSGVIDRIPNRRGSLTDEGTLLTTLSDNSEVYAYFNVSEREYLAYAKSKERAAGQNSVSLILADNSPHPFKGSIETIEGEFDQGTGSIAFRARFNNPNQVLRHGASGKVRLRRHLRRALVIPQKATFEIQDRMYVYVLGSDNKVKRRSIVSRLRLPHLYVVASGLQANEKIVYEGIQELSEGQTVQPKLMQPRQLLPLLARQ